ncbi:hypothetical protein Bca52824_092699 [Brassica carinata]|uniref:Uncharacterized protein n=1 Tax=Brassica carinata TaxID=52824 RepID=A0A8X7P6H4_BRACI|nr:hypothetical protein Bca52824_092699 [Brassica carinata]
MDFNPILLLSFLLILISIKFLFKNSTRKLNLPPSPAYSLPFIGHLYLLKHPVQRTLLSLSITRRYSYLPPPPRNRLVYVVSSYSVAEECFTRNDVVLANRPELIMGKHVAYDSTIMIAAPYGDHWRNLRRVAAVEIFSS